MRQDLYDRSCQPPDNGTQATPIKRRERVTVFFVRLHGTGRRFVRCFTTPKRNRNVTRRWSVLLYSG